MLCASYFNFQCSIFNSIDYNAPADAPMRNKRKGYQPFINYKFRIASYKLVAHRAMLNYVIINLKFTVDGVTVYSFLFTSNFRAKLSRNYTIININIKPCDLEISVLSVKSVCYFFWNWTSSPPS